jgi:putative DNA primase/helicase
MIDLRTLQRALGGEICGGQLSCPGPGHSPKDRSLCVRLSGDDFVVYSHAGNDWRDCRDYVRQRLGLPAWQLGDGRDRSVAASRLAAFNRATVDAESERRPRTQEDLARIARALAIWNEAVDPRGTRAEQYLASRALTLDDDVAGKVLRYRPSCPWRDENTGATVGVPALFAAFTSIDDDTVTAVHRIRLDQPERWPKADRRMLGVVHRAAVKLDQAGDILHVGEGIETCLAARQLGHAPAWALGSVGAIAKFPLIDGIGRLAILGETGAASANAIQLCGHRWHRAGRKVQVIMPDTGSDLNDELMAATP